MFSTQTKTKNESRVLLTPIALKNPQTVNGYCYNFPVPDERLPEYGSTMSRHGAFYQEVCDLFHDLYPQPPYRTDHFLKFLKNYWGISTTVCYFTNPSKLIVKGAWEWEDEKRSSVKIRIESTLPDAEKKFTTFHEVFHIIQDLDPSFLTMIETCHPDIRLKVVERIADKSAVEAMLPRHEYDRWKREKKTNSQIADMYRVSMGLVSNFKV